MGSYGIGPARIAAAAVEQYADEQGIAWPKAIAPFDVEVVALGKPGTPERDGRRALYGELRAGGLEVLLDDRDAGPGEKFADAELLGAPLRLTVGRRSLESGPAEAQARRGLEDFAGGIPLEEAARGGEAGCGRASREAPGRDGLAAPRADVPAPERAGPLRTRAAADACRARR